MFRFDSDEWSKKFALTTRTIQEIARIFFRNQSSHTDFVRWHYQTQHKEGEPLTPEEGHFLEALSTWHDRVTLFVFGFLVHKISEEIRTIYAAGTVDKFEEEIWVTQFWNININRVINC